jgi:hypothetical protein
MIISVKLLRSKPPVGGAQGNVAVRKEYFSKQAIPLYLHKVSLRLMAFVDFVLTYFRQLTL